MRLFIKLTNQEQAELCHNFNAQPAQLDQFGSHTCNHILLVLGKSEYSLELKLLHRRIFLPPPGNAAA